MEDAVKIIWDEHKEPSAEDVRTYVEAEFSDGTVLTVENLTVHEMRFQKTLPNAKTDVGINIKWEDKSVPEKHLKVELLPQKN